MSVDEPTPTTTTTTMAARNSSEGEWQMLDPDDVNNEGEMEWQMHHRNKKLTVGMSDKLAKYFNQKRSKTAGGKDRSADKHAAEPAPALRPASTSSRSMVWFFWRCMASCAWLEMLPHAHLALFSSRLFVCDLAGLQVACARGR